MVIDFTAMMSCVIPSNDPIELAELICNSFSNSSAFLEDSDAALVGSPIRPVYMMLFVVCWLMVLESEYRVHG